MSLKTNELRQEIFNIIKTMQKSIDEIFNTLQIVNKNNNIFLDFKNKFNVNFNIERFNDEIKLNVSSVEKDFDKKLDQIGKSQTVINSITKTLEEKEESLNIDDVKKNLDKELFSIKMEVIEMKNYLKIFNRDDFVAKLKHFHDHYDNLKKTLENHKVRLFDVRSDLSIMMSDIKDFLKETSFEEFMENIKIVKDQNKLFEEFKNTMQGEFNNLVLNISNLLEEFKRVKATNV